MTRLRDEAVEAMVERLGVMYPKWHPTNRRIVAIRLLAALPAGVYVSDGQGHVAPVDGTEVALAFNHARNALIAGRSALACQEPLSPELRDHMSRAIARCEESVIALAALSATDTEKTGGDPS